ncbi:DUF2855 family protein [Reyranella sp. CPCC 100927]|uniref:DUF2855 family protein n=1 Tax=Reyranella sp. CPCC 100927 TaxID=2599616 RepID=UPI0011B53787|nr:DUF2855 family protein [Reyranella sp. CPCC 100927]TWT05093.1 DUF2855 family protein [Reyranella sp. CPCC 100927]
MSTAWDFVVAKSDLCQARMVPAADPNDVPLASDQSLLAVERFALTANNITYGVIGESFGYWRFFPAEAGLGRIPVWGYARVIRSGRPDVAVGQRVFGYLPPSSHMTATLQAAAGGFVDAAPHRADLPATYNRYAAVSDDAGIDDYRALLRPLFMTSFLIDDLLSEQALFGGRSVLLSSASSKTALGLAWLLHRRGVAVTGLSAPSRVDFLRGLGFFDRVEPYAQVAELDVPAPVVFVDFAGDPAVVGAVHHRFGDALAHSAIVGGTHWQAMGAGGGDALPGPEPTLFFAPDQVRKRLDEWGAATLEARFNAAMRAFVADNGWLRIEHHRGPEALLRVYAQVLEGRSNPDVGHIVIPA